MRPSEKAWVALAVGVAGYELLATDGELMSHAVDAWLERHPIVTVSVVALTAGHLLNILPERIDPYHWMFNARRRRASS